MTISGIKYFFKGVDSVESKFHRKKHEVQDKTVATQGSNNFSGRAVTLEKIDTDKKEQKNVCVDDAVNITTVIDSVRAAAQGKWNQLTQQSHRTFVATLITGIVATVAGVALAGAAFTFPPLIIAAVPVFIVGIALLVAAKKAYTNEKNAKRMHGEWKDPVADVQNQRRSAACEGFKYAFQNKSLVGKSLHLDEVSFLREQYVNRFIAEHERGINADRVESFKSFFKVNPFSKEVVDFASGGRANNGMAALISDYGREERSFNQLLRDVQGKRDRVESERNREIKHLVAKRNDDLDTLRLIHLAGNELLKSENAALELEKKGLRYDHGRPLHVQLEPIRWRQINQKITSNNLTIAINQGRYESAATPVNIEYRRGEIKVNQKAERKQEEINTLERTEILKYKGAILALIQKFRVEIQPPPSVDHVHATAPTLPTADSPPAGVTSNSGASAPPLDVLDEPADAPVNAYDISPDAQPLTYPELRV